MVLKSVYEVERSPYLYSVRKFLSHPMWDVTNIHIHAEKTSPLYPMRLRGQYPIQCFQFLFALHPLRFSMYELL